MVIARTSMSIAALALCVSLVACSGTGEPSSGADPTVTSSATPAPEPSASSAPSANSGATTPDEPVAKIERAGHSDAPTVKADPADTSDAVSYDDGVSVRIDDVSFGKETSQGPGSFPGREYARLTITIDNGSSDSIDLGTSVLTVLDASGATAVRVYAAEAEVTDFAGTVAAGKSATATYAFALPVDARDEVTVVVDFDGDHTSAVFRGGLD
jgi:hypothetical protein